jgi:hypothetical protein
MSEAQTKNVNEEEGGDAMAPPAVAAAAAAAVARQRSTIEFPYVNLEDCEESAVAIFSEAGMTELSVTQAAAAMGTTVDSSSFRVKLSAMRLFGLLTVEQQRVGLTQLAREICENDTKARARVTAFLNVPLYVRLVQEHEGHTLPQAPALEKEIISYGVGAKVADRARQAFDKSAKHANFIRPGSDRFVTPILASPRAETKSATTETQEQSAPGSGDGDGPDDGVDPVIKALVAKIPPTGTQWPLEEQVYLLQMLAMTFHMTYKNRRPIKVSAEPDAAVRASGDATQSS